MKSFMALVIIIVGCSLIGSCGGDKSDLSEKATQNEIIDKDYPQFKQGERVEVFFTGGDGQKDQKGKKGQRGWWAGESNTTITIRLIGNQESVIPKSQIQQLRKDWRGLGS